MTRRVPSPWLLKLSPSCTKSRPRLFCFPPAGANPYFFCPLARLLRTEVEVFSASLPGRPPWPPDIRETSFCSLVASLAEAIGSVAPLDDAVFLGHSMGAHLAHQTCLALGESGAVPAALIVSSAREPRGYFAEAKELASEDSRDLLDRLRMLGGIPEELLECPDRDDLYLNAFRDDCRASADHAVDSLPPLNMPLLVIGGSQDIHVPASCLLNWQSASSDTCKLHIMNGGHFYLAEQWDTTWAAIASFLRIHAPQWR